MEYFAALVVKLMVKHAWPAKYKLLHGSLDDGGTVSGFMVYEQGHEDDEWAPDMQAAFEAACRIVAKTYRVEYRLYDQWADLTQEYRVTEGGHFRKVK